MYKQIIYNDLLEIYKKGNEPELYTEYKGKEYMIFSQEEGGFIYEPSHDILSKIVNNLLSKIKIEDNEISIEMLYSAYYSSSTKTNSLGYLHSLFEIEMSGTGIMLNSYKGTSIDFEGQYSIEDFINKIKDYNSFEFVDLIDKKNKKGLC